MTASSLGPLEFFDRLKWLDGKPLIDTIEPYRRELFTLALGTFREDGLPAYNMVLAGRGKKNYKSCDLVLAALYKLLIPESMQGNDAFILANDEKQAGDDLDLAKKLVLINEDELGNELTVLAKEIKRNDGRGALQILPARDAIGAHGKTGIFLGFDEIHGYRSYDLFEALAPDPTRTDVLQWITSYDTIFNHPGIPLHDMKQIGMSGEDPRMLFSWYSGSFCTDLDYAELPPEERSNPSMPSWPDGAGYLVQQKRRLPAHKYRRLHLNLPGAPTGAYYDPDSVIAAIIPRRTSLPPDLICEYVAFVDMSGGSSDDATLGIAHVEAGKTIVDLVIKQNGDAPFNPRHAVTKFVGTLRAYGIRRVTGDNYAGSTFKHDFEAAGISYIPCNVSKTILYEELEPKFNAGEVELPDVSKLQEQLLGLVVRGARIDHIPNEHDDFANAAAGVVWCASGQSKPATAASGRFNWG